MKKILSIAAIALFSFSVLFTACRNDAGTQTEEAPAVEETAPAVEETQEAAAPVDTAAAPAQ